MEKFSCTNKKNVKRVSAFLLVMVMLFSNMAIVFADDNENYYYTTSRLNFRTGPSTNDDKIQVLPLGTKLEYIETNGNGWYKVKYNGQEGYVSAEFVVQAPDYTGIVSGAVTMTPWAEAKGIFTIGLPAQVLDVRTGLTYQVKSFSNGNHADVEPITKEDTAIMLQTYGGRWSWDTRPVIVTINGKSMAASINGMPHASGVNNNNGMNGQVCIHFKDSRTHNGNKSHEADHQRSVLEAYNWAN